MIAKEVHLGSAEGAGLPDEPILLTLIRQAEHRKPFVPQPSNLNVLATATTVNSSNNASTLTTIAEGSKLWCVWFMAD